MEQTTAIHAGNSEVSGAFLLGLVGSLGNVSTLQLGGVNIDLSTVTPDRWYPYERLMEVFDAIERTGVSSHVLMRAGVTFLRIWYDHGPGKAMIHSTRDWLLANSASGGYNSVVRGGSPEQIGWCLPVKLDLEAGVVVYENVMRMPRDFLRGVFYGGCLIFDDLDYVEVDAESFDYPQNPNFRRTLVTVRFRTREAGVDIDARLAELACGRMPTLSPQEQQALLWRHKGLLARQALDTGYTEDANALLSQAIAASRAQSAELALAKEQADAANLAKSRFLSGMSHELRTPLNAILGFAQILQRDPEVGARQQASLDTIVKAGDHLLSLINNVLDIAKIEAGKTELQVQDLDIGELIVDTIGILEGRAQAKGLELMIDPSSSFPRHVRGDGPKIRQVLFNLIGNAIKFTERGSVRLRLHLVPSPDDERLCLQFEVVDTGPGIAAADRERIFRPFEQTSLGHAAKDSTGLGLTIAREFVRMMGGEIELESQLGVGTTFRLRIVVDPVDQGSIAALHHDKVHTVAIEGAAACRILLVEDQIENRLLVRALLEPFGFQLVEACDGQEALERAPQVQPHLVLLDRRMPGMDGTDVARRLRRMPFAAPPVILALTAQAMAEERREMIEAGCDAFLAKPFKETDLFRLLARYLPIKLILADEGQPRRPAPSTVNPGDLAALSPEWRSQLDASLTMGDMDALRTLAAEIEPTLPALAALVVESVDRFDLGPLHAMLLAEA